MMIKANEEGHFRNDIKFSDEQLRYIVYIVYVSMGCCGT